MPGGCFSNEPMTNRQSATRLTPIPILAAMLLGCTPKFLPDFEGFAIPEASPAPTPLRSNDPALDPRLRLARFSFTLLVIGGLAGIVALQARMSKGKGQPEDGRQEAIGWPIAAFGIGFGLPFYVYSVAEAERQLVEAHRKRLAPGTHQ